VPFLLHPQPLLNAEPMLLVHDDEREMGEIEAFLEQRVRAHDDAHVAARNGFERASPHLCRLRAGHQRHGQVKRMKPLAEVPPVLFGHEFLRNDVFQLWGLHAWVWKDNPSGMFANWNPRVTCAYASAISTMAH